MLRKDKRKEPHHLWKAEGHLLIMHNRAFIEITVTVVIITITKTKTNDIKDVDKLVNM